VPVDGLLTRRILPLAFAPIRWRAEAQTRATGDMEHMSSIRCLAALVAAVLCTAPAVPAATASGASTSPLGGNGHNVSFDGRIFIVARGDGWHAQVPRPEMVGRDAHGWADFRNAFAPSRLIQPLESCENGALAAPAA
jgi:hypothetical protein